MIYLREITQNDLPRINQWRQDQEMVSLLGDAFRYVNIESDEEWFKNYCHNRARNIRLAICLSSDNTHIGNVYLLNIDHIARNAAYHMFIGDTTQQDKGYGTLATQLCLKHGFNDCNLHRIYMSVLSSNKRCIAVCEKNGFAQEGVARQETYKNGAYHDITRMAILRQDFDKLYSKL